MKYFVSTDVKSKWEKTWSIRSHKHDNNCLNNQVKDNFQFEITKELGYNEDGDVAFRFFAGQRDQRSFGVQGELSFT